MNGSSDDYKVLLRRKVVVYGAKFHIELRQKGDMYYFVDVYENCEHDRGIPYETLCKALDAFESVCGVTLTDEMKEYLNHERISEP